jgi:transcriptional regulator with XRE-family HTH domain
MGMSAHEIAAAIKHLLDERGWTQAELARRMPVSRGTLNNLMNGYRRWNLETLEKAANALGVELVQITGAVPLEGKTSGRICVELAPSELRDFREIAADELRTPENLLHLLVVRHIRDKKKQ